MTQVAIFHSPSLCGCQLKIAADWTPNAVVDGVSYRHPKPFTISKIEIVSVCDEHKNISPVIDPAPFLEKNADGEIFQARGYLKMPIENPTPAEILYVYLYRYTGNTMTPDTCGCKIYSHHERDKDNMKIVHHPAHSKYCKRHKNDHHAAIAENRAANKGG